MNFIVFTHWSHLVHITLNLIWTEQPLQLFLYVAISEIRLICELMAFLVLYVELYARVCRDRDFRPLLYIFYLVGWYITHINLIWLKYNYFIAAEILSEIPLEFKDWIDGSIGVYDFISNICDLSFGSFGPVFRIIIALVIQIYIIFTTADTLGSGKS